jgi:hypothetical protein
MKHLNVDFEDNEDEKEAYRRISVDDYNDLGGLAGEFAGFSGGNDLVVS